MNDQTFIPPRLAEIAAEFSAASREEKLELLLEFSEQLPPLPPELRDHRGLEQVHECMSPVFVIAQRHGEQIEYYIDVPPEAPTIRGFAAILRQGMNGLTPEQALAVSSAFIQQMGLHQVLSPQRLNGINALLVYMKRQALRLLEGEQVETI
ncbi:MAG: cysteine desulfuration protein SufE [Chloroflexus aggregans]|uniref:Cysteine desulfuration protein SufE n=1 Tax=Chloroflexus aggregans TaxID=152260 RepID=A0A2J6X4L0_9CHLR|nr:MAG: cysteine desulfuration protein SufE [Chloroflexus aggregans]